MLNEWFFKWHQINFNPPVEIDSFDGRKITYGGITFWGSSREVYWHTLARYIRKKIDEVFREIECVLETYPHSAAIDALDDTERELTAFINQICNDAVEKDRVLRGDGFSFPPRDTERRYKLLSSSDVRERTQALRHHLNLIQQAQSTNSNVGDKDPQLVTLRPGIWGISLDLKVAWKRIATYFTR